MYPSKYDTARGQVRRTTIEAALLQAGEAGLRLTDLCHAVGLKDAAITWHLQRMSSVYWPRVPVARHRRIWHISHAAAADRHLQARRETPPARNASTTQMAEHVLQLVQQAGPAGIARAELAATLRVGRTALERAITTLHKAGALRRVPDPQGHHHNCCRFAAADPNAPPAKPVKPTFSQRRAKGLHPYIAASAVASRQVSPPSRSVQDGPAGLQGLVLKPGAKVTVVKHTDPRAEAAATALPLFSALSPGRYLDHDTAIARAYGGQQQPTNAGR